MLRTALRSLPPGLRRIGRAAFFTAGGIEVLAALAGVASLVAPATVFAREGESTGDPAAAHAQAVRLARAGQTAEALSRLEELARKHPQDVSIAWDLVVIRNWAGRDAEAVRSFEALPPGNTPAYVLEAAARSYRNLGQFSEAVALYRRAREREPGDAGAIAGEIESLTDSPDAAAALRLAERALQAHGGDVAVLVAASYAARAAQVPVEALRYADRALAIEPGNRDALRQRLLAIDALRISDVALRLARANPGLLSAEEMRRFEGNAAAALVRWGPLEPPSEAERFAATDRAIAELDALIARWSKEGPSAAADLRRARLDRLIALHERSRMSEVVAEYESLSHDGGEIPAYVLPAVAGAYLYLRQPETARDLYRRAIAADPKNMDARLGLFHALIETEEFEEARQVVDEAARLPSPWIYLKGSPLPKPNDDKFAADLAAANERLYAEDLPEAELRFAGLSDAAPNNTTARVGLANAYASRSWPRRAREELQIAQAQKPQDLDIEAARARNDLALQDWPRAEAEISGLARRFPESLDVQQLERDWENHRRWELQVTAERDLRATSNVIGGNALTVGAQLYSPPIADDWRLFGGDRIAHEREPEGNITERLYDIGAEYRHGDVTATAAALMAQYGPQRFGAQVGATWSLDDRWSLGGGGGIFSVNTPLRALLNRITADEVDLKAGYRESESRAFLATAQVLPFSDGNLRSILGGHAEQRICSAPHWHLDATLDLAASQNTRTGTPYFNPRHDASSFFGIDATQILYRRYDFSYDHRLVATIGRYWEQNFGTGGAWGVRYEHRIRADDRLEAALGVGFSRQPYDGVYESSIAFTLNLTWRF